MHLMHVNVREIFIIPIDLENYQRTKLGLDRMVKKGPVLSSGPHPVIVYEYMKNATKPYIQMLTQNTNTNIAP